MKNTRKEQKASSRLCHIVLAVILALCMILGTLTGCARTNEGASGSSVTTAEETTAEETTAEETTAEETTAEETTAEETTSEETTAEETTAEETTAEETTAEETTSEETTAEETTAEETTAEETTAEETTAEETTAEETSAEETTAEETTAPAETEPLGCVHSYSVKTVAATCTTDGYTEKTCRLCGESEITDNIPALGHNYIIHNTVLATPEAGGYDEHYCSRCLYCLRDNETPKIDWTVESQGFVFKSNGDGTCRITDLGSCTDRYILIPARSPEGDLVTAVNSIFSGNSNIIEVRFPDAVTTLPQFYNCARLESVTLPKGCTKLTENTFYNCSKLSRIDFNGAPVSVIPANAFYSVAITSIVLPDSITEIGERAFSGLTALTSVICGPELTKVGERAFDGCKNLREFRCASSEYSLDTLKSIGESAFRFTALEKVAFSSELISIGATAFSGTKMPYEIDLGNTKLTYIGSSAFQNSTVQGVVLPETLESIGNWCFDGCLKLTRVVLPDSLKKIGSYAFQNCEKLESLYLGRSLQNIGSNAFDGITAELIWCEAPTIKTIAYGAFAGYLGKKLVIPDSVTRIDGGFSRCTNLQLIQIPFVGLDADNENSSYDCFGFLFGTDVNTWDQEDVIPRSLKTVILRASGSIASRQFMGVNIEQIVLGDGITSISSSAFDGVTTLKNVYFEGTAAQWAAVSNSSAEVSAATLWLYSETAPTAEGNYWHYGENGEIVRY